MKISDKKIECKDCNDIISDVYTCSICHGKMCKKCKIRKIVSDKEYIYCYICYTDNGCYNE